MTNKIIVWICVLVCLAFAVNARLFGLDCASDSSFLLRDSCTGSSSWNGHPANVSMSNWAIIGVVDGTIQGGICNATGDETTIKVRWTENTSYNKVVYVEFMEEVAAKVGRTYGYHYENNPTEEQTIFSYTNTGDHYCTNAGGVIYSNITVGHWYYQITEINESQKKVNCFLYDRDTDELLASAIGQAWSRHDYQIDILKIQSYRYLYDNFMVINDTGGGRYSLLDLNATSCAVPPIVVSNFSVTANSTNGGAISNFNITVDGVFYTTSTGSITTHLLDNSSSLYDIVANASGFLGTMLYNVNVSSNLVINFTPYTYFNLTNITDLITGEVLNFSVDINGEHYTTSNGTIVTRIPNNDYTVQLYDFTLSSEHYVNRTFTSYNITQNVAAERLYGLRAYATDYLGNTVLPFNVEVGSYIYRINSTNNIMPVGAGSYVFYIDNSSYEYANVTKTIVVNYTYAGLSTHNITFSGLFTYNSISITIREEETSNLINNTNISILFTSDFTEFTNTTDNGTLYLDNLISGEYTLLFSGGDYDSRTYTLTLFNRSHQDLTAYLAPNTSTTTFTVTDIDTSGLLENVLATMYRMVNDTWVPIETKYTDITGRVVFNYLAGKKYKFFFSHIEYNDYIFYLNPILYSSYDISLTKSLVLNSTTDYDQVAIRYFPTTFINGQLNNFSFLIQSPSGELIDYGFNLTYPNGFTAESGSNAIGSQINTVINISGASSFDTVRFDYYYTTTLAGTRTFTYFFTISNTETTANTFIANKDKTYGLGIFERIFAITLLTIIIVGVCSLVGQQVAGLALGLFCMSYFAYNGFIPLWSILISLLIGLFMLATTGGR